MDREKVIVRTSFIGIGANVLLAAFKAFVGLTTNSIAVILDAVNNLSDALSSIITIIGTKLANKAPDRKHPMGHGRIEYLSSMIVAGIVLYAGITSAVESVKKIIHPETASYTTLSLVIIAVAIGVKLLLGFYVKSKGKQVDSGALIASGSDASFDAILSASVLISALIFMITGISLESYVGLVISVVIIKAGIEMMTETLNDLLGRRIDADLSVSIKKMIAEEPEIRGAYDLFISNYGPGRDYASVHIEVPDTMSVKELDTITRRVERRVAEETGILLTGIGVYSYNTSSDEAAQMRDRIAKKILAYDWAVQMHGFYVDFEKKQVQFDVVRKFSISPKDACEILNRDMAEMYPDYCFQIAPDVDLSD